MLANRRCSKPSLKAPSATRLSVKCVTLHELLSDLPQNFPFATIEPEDSRVIVPDDRFDWLCEHYKPKSKVPAHMDIFDIAGLTRGASTGAGLGNAFLSHIRAVDAIFQVTRCFEDAEIIHIEGDVDAVRDLKIIANELRIKDTEFAEKALENLAKQTRGKAKSLEIRKLEEEQNTVQKVIFALSKMKVDVRKVKWTPKEVEAINSLLLLTAKPVVYLLNVSEQNYISKKAPKGSNIMKWIKDPRRYDAVLREDAREKAIAKGSWTEADQAKFQAIVDEEKIENDKIDAQAKKLGIQVDESGSDPSILISVSFEERLTRFETDAEVAAECDKVGVKSNLPKLITTMRTALQLDSFFTTGTDEVRQWTIRKGTKAPAAAGVIHTDFQKTFIQAIVYNYKTLKEEGDEATVRAKGKIMTKGKDYVVDDGDILLIKAGAAKA